MGADTVLVPLLPPTDVAEAGDAALQEVEAEQDLQHEEPRQEHLHENHGDSLRGTLNKRRSITFYIY